MSDDTEALLARQTGNPNCTSHLHTRSTACEQTLFPESRPRKTIPCHSDLGRSMATNECEVLSGIVSALAATGCRATFTRHTYHGASEQW